MINLLTAATTETVDITPMTREEMIEFIQIFLQNLPPEVVGWIKFALGAIIFILTAIPMIIIYYNKVVAAWKSKAIFAATKSNEENKTWEEKSKEYAEMMKQILTAVETNEKTTVEAANKQNITNQLTAKLLKHTTFDQDDINDITEMVAQGKELTNDGLELIQAAKETAPNINKELISK